MDFLSEPHTPLEAVTLGLYLALTAPTEEKAQECAEIAEHIAQSTNLSEHDLDAAKTIAQATYEVFYGDGKEVHEEY